MLVHYEGESEGEHTRVDPRDRPPPRRPSILPTGALGPTFRHSPNPHGPNPPNPNNNHHNVTSSAANNGNGAYRRPMQLLGASKSARNASASAHDVANPAALTTHFRAYIRQLNQRLPSSLRLYLAPRVSYNGRRMSADAFAGLACPPGATVSSEFVVADVTKRLLAARIEVEVTSSHHTSTTPSTPTNGTTSVPESPLEDKERELRRGSGSSVEHISEHVFYHFDENWRIDEVWSVGEAKRPDSPKRREGGRGPGNERRRMSIQSMDDYRF